MVEAEQITAKVFSPRSGREVANLELDRSLSEPGEVMGFRIISGYGSLWQKSFDEEPLVVVADETHYSFRVVAFPAERTGTGYLELRAELPPLERRTQSASRNGAAKRGLMHRMRKLLP